MKVLCGQLGEKIYQAEGEASEAGTGVGRISGMIKEKPSVKKQKECVKSERRGGKRVNVSQIAWALQIIFDTDFYGE